MKQHRQSHISISWVIATALALASAGVLAGDKVNTSGRTAEVQGRSSSSPAGAGVHEVRVTGKQFASEVFGRASQVSKASGPSVGLGQAEIGDFGRSSMTLAKNKSAPGQEGVTLATSK